MLNKDVHLLEEKAPGLRVLNEVLDTIRFQGSIFFHSDLSAPWGISFPAASHPRFHVALAGGFFVGAEKNELALAEMDVVMIPNGGCHWIADDPSRELVSSESCASGLVTFQTGEITNRIMCGMVCFDEAISHPITGALPDILRIEDIKSSDSIWLTVRQIDAEILRAGHVSSTLVDRFTEILFVQILDRYITENEHLSGFFAVLNNPHLVKVLELIHKYPERAWTLDTLSHEIGMSRATLQRKFKLALAISPITYLSQWRMAKAYQWLKYSSLSMEKIAEKIGFSESKTMRTAFQRQYGVSASAIRKLYKID